MKRPTPAIVASTIPTVAAIPVPVPDGADVPDIVPVVRVRRSTIRKSGYEEGSLDQYLRDISIYPLISRDEEIGRAHV